MTKTDDATPDQPQRSRNAGNRHASASASASSEAEATSSSTGAAHAKRTFFDPWNSSSSGHQRAENRLSGSTSWRVSRSLKLGEQFKAGRSGGAKRIADTVGAGSEDFGKDGRKENGSYEKGAKGLRPGGQKSLAEVWGASKKGSTLSQQKTSNEHVTPERGNQEAHLNDDIPPASSNPPEKLLFAGLCFYINGSTAPLVSDHKLKQLLASHGAKHSIALGRRTVTHVVLGTTSTDGGAGGGLASSKMQKESLRSGSKTVKFINAHWVLDSIAANRRLAESRYSPVKLAPQSSSTTASNMFSMMRQKRDHG